MLLASLEAHGAHEKVLGEEVTGTGWRKRRVTARLARLSPSEGDSSTGWERRGGVGRKRVSERETRQDPEGLMEDCSRAPGGRVLLASVLPEKVAGHRRRCGVRGRADRPHWEMLSTALLEVETELQGWGPCLQSRPAVCRGQGRRGGDKLQGAGQTEDPDAGVEAGLGD